MFPRWYLFGVLPVVAVLSVAFAIWIIQISDATMPPQEPTQSVILPKVVSVSQAEALNRQYEWERNEARKNIQILDVQIQGLRGEYDALCPQKTEYAYSRIYDDAGRVFEAETWKDRPDIIQRLQTLQDEMQRLEDQRAYYEDILQKNLTAR